ncbi:MAG: glycosyltransferase family 9 protein [Gemmatimonadaceae bacterium]
MVSPRGGVPDRICIVMMSAVGDAVHVLPVINALKRANPATRITWVLQPGAAALVRGHRSVDEIILFDRSRGWQAFAAVREELARRPFDLVINLQVYFKAGIVTSFTRAPVKLGFDRARARDFNWAFTNRKIPARPVQHVQDQYFEFLQALGVSPEPIEWDLGPWPPELEWRDRFASSIARPIAAIVVGTSKPEKDWIPQRWAEVTDTLHAEFGMQVVLVGGTSKREQEAARIVTGLARSKPRSELGSGLRGLVSIIDASALVLSPDTGPLHMSVALDRPVISLMGYTNPKRTGPYRRFQDLIIDAYGEPGEDYPISMENRPDRMKRIETENVLEKVQLWRERYSRRRGGQA